MQRRELNSDTRNCNEDEAADKDQKPSTEIPESGTGTPEAQDGSDELPPMVETRDR
jgi:hypothetical protein